MTDIPLEVTARIYDAGGGRAVTFTWVGTVDNSANGTFLDITPEDLDALLNESLLADEQCTHVPRMLIAQLDTAAPKRRFSLKSMGSCTCGICLDAYTSRTSRYVRKLPCGHVFCCKCVDRWVTQHSATCPTCREELPSAD